MKFLSWQVAERACFLSCHTNTKSNGRVELAESTNLLSEYPLKPLKKEEKRTKRNLLGDLEESELHNRKSNVKRKRALKNKHNKKRKQKKTMAAELATRRPSGEREEEDEAAVEGLPSVLLLQILAFLDHGALHAVERTATVFHDLVRSESRCLGTGRLYMMMDSARLTGMWCACRPVAQCRRAEGGVRANVGRAERVEEDGVPRAPPRARRQEAARRRQKCVRGRFVLLVASPLVC